MSLLFAASEPDWGVLITDTRAPVGVDGFDDDHAKQTGIVGGAVGWAGFDLQYADRLSGADFADLGAAILDAWHDGRARAERRDSARDPAERAWAYAANGTDPEDPDARDVPYFAKFAAVGFADSEVRIYRAGAEDFDRTRSVIFYPPGVTPDQEHRIETRAREAGRAESGDDPWSPAVRAGLAVVAGVADVHPRVGPVADVTILDRLTGERSTNRRRVDERD